MRISDWSSDVCSSDLERHGVDDAVRLGGRRHLALADPPAQVEGVTHAAVGAVPRHDGLLDRHLALGATVQPDRKRVVSGKSVSVRVDLGGSRIIKKKIQSNTSNRNKPEYSNMH